MKTTLYYFSATGNNLAVARDLARELPEPVDIIPITKLMNEGIIKVESDSVGIIFPVYLRDIPQIVEEFASRLEVKENTYVFAICTYHKDSFNALFNLEKVLEQRNIKLSAGFCINMPGTSVVAVDFTSTEEENEVRLREEREKIKKISEVITAKTNAGIEGAYNQEEPYESRNFMRNVYKMVEQFWVEDSCNLCGICTKVCPRGIIKIVNKKVVWEGNCENCQACLHWCPMKAVQNGTNSEKCRRYHHPDVSLSEIINSR